MDKRTYLEDIISIALLYRKAYVGTDMISYDKLLEFDKIVNKNLDSMNSQCLKNVRGSDYVAFYRLVTDENGNKFAVILSNANLEYAWKIHMGLASTDTLTATQMDNALNVIGLEKIIKNNEVSIVQKSVKKKKNDIILKLVK